MKKLLLTVLAAAALVAAKEVSAGVFTLAGSGVNIPANSSTNFTNMSLPVYGTFTLPLQNIYITQNGITNTNQVFLTNLLSFDGTNFFKLSQLYTFTTTNAVNGTLMVITNIALPVYGAIAVSNGQGQVITNFGATGQF